MSVDRRLIHHLVLLLIGLAALSVLGIVVLVGLERAVPSVLEQIPAGSTATALGLLVQARPNEEFVTLTAEAIQFAPLREADGVSSSAAEPGGASPPGAHAAGLALA